jgi:hypothetical protein
MIALFISSLFLFAADLLAEDLSRDQRIQKLAEGVGSVTEEVRAFKSSRETGAVPEEIEPEIKSISGGDR